MPSAQMRKTDTGHHQWLRRISKCLGSMKRQQTQPQLIILKTAYFPIIARSQHGLAPQNY
jgi:hypothetical protein